MASFSAKFWIWVLKVTSRKDTFLSADALHATMQKRAKMISYKPSEYVLKRCDVVETTVDGYPVVTITPKAGTNGDVLFYLHGGAYVFEIIERQWMFIADTACRLGRTAIIPIYPLAPKATAPDVLKFAEAAYLYAETVVGDRRLDIFGDSAGASMALSMLQILKAKSHSVKAKTLSLLSPWFDISLDNPEVDEIDKIDPWLSKPGLVEAGKLYAGDIAADDARVSPVYGDLKGLPTCHVFIGMRDLMVADCRRFRDKMQAENLSLGYHEYEGMFHCWPVVKSPEGEDMKDKLIKILAE